MNIPKLIKEAHDIAIERGDYHCPECDEGKTIRFACYTGEHTEIIEDCDNCDGTDIDPNKNIGELLMNIVTKLGKVAETHNQGRFADWESYERGIQQLKNSCSMWKDIEGDMMFTKEGKNYFLAYIESTFGDEIADVFIRLFDLCGYLGIEPVEPKQKIEKIESLNIGENLLVLVDHVISFRYQDYTDWAETFIHTLNVFCFTYDIPIEKHIKAKMAYNRSLI